MRPSEESFVKRRRVLASCHRMHRWKNPDNNIFCSCPGGDVGFHLIFLEDGSLSLSLKVDTVQCFIALNGLESAESVGP